MWCLLTSRCPAPTKGTGTGRLSTVAPAIHGRRTVRLVDKGNLLRLTVVSPVVDGCKCTFVCTCFFFFYVDLKRFTL